MAHSILKWTEVFFCCDSHFSLSVCQWVKVWAVCGRPVTTGFDSAGSFPEKAGSRHNDTAKQTFCQLMSYSVPVVCRNLHVLLLHISLDNARN